MPAITDFINRVVPQDPSTEQAELTLGLPLETESKTIYPVFEETGVRTDRRLQQVGYLEIGDGRSDYVSIKPRDGMPIVVLGFAAIAMAVALWIARRIRG